MKCYSGLSQETARKVAMDSLCLYSSHIHMHINTHSHMYGHADTHTTHAHIQPASGLSCWKLSLLAAASSSSALTIPKALAVCTGSSLWQTEPNIVQPAAKFSRVFCELLPQGHRIIIVGKPHQPSLNSQCLSVVLWNTR